jgi:hypothetical protein
VACNLSPGLYVFTDPLLVSGTVNIVAPGVTFYFACGSGGFVTTCGGDPSPGEFVMSGTPQLHLSAPIFGPRKGLAILFDRANDGAFSILGAGGGSVSGTIYAPAATLDIQVPACSTTIDSMVVIADLKFSAPGGCLTTAYTPANNVDATVTTRSKPGLTK